MHELLILQLALLLLISCWCGGRATDFKINDQFPDFLEHLNAIHIRDRSQQQNRFTSLESNSSSGVNGFVFYEFYIDTACAEAPVYSTGYLTNYCIKQEDGTSFIISFTAAATCTDLSISYFTDDSCSDFDFTITSNTTATDGGELDDFTDCLKADSLSLGSFKGLCREGTEFPPVSNDVILVERKESDLTCEGRSVSFIAYATDTCISNNVDRSSVQFRCNTQYDGVRMLVYDDSDQCDITLLSERQLYTSGCSTSRHFTNDTFDDDALKLPLTTFASKSSSLISQLKQAEEKQKRLRAVEADTSSSYLRRVEKEVISEGMIKRSTTNTIATLFENRLEDFICEPYVQEGTNSATLRYDICSIYACPGDVKNITMCDHDAECAGDTFLRLFDSFQNEVFVPSASEDDACGLCTQFTFSFVDICQTYELREGCYGETACTGTVVVRDITPPSPTFLPTPMPSAPLPTAPSTQIRFCSPFDVANTNSASENFGNCTFEACPGETLSLGTCTGLQGECSGDTFLRLVDSDGIFLASDDDSCDGDKCAVITYTFTEPCQEYVIQEGCFGDGTCSGLVTITGDIYNITEFPTSMPSESPPTSHPTITPRFCQSYQGSDTNMAQENVDVCEIYACGNTELILSSCRNGGFCEGDQFLRLFDQDGELKAIDDDSCGKRSCSEIVYRTVGGCQTYQLFQGCFDQESCSGQVSITTTADSLDLTFFETSCVNAPTVAPTTAAPTSNNLIEFTAAQSIDGVNRATYEANIDLHESVLKLAIARCMSGVDSTMIIIDSTIFVSSRRRSRKRYLNEDGQMYTNGRIDRVDRRLQLEVLDVTYTVTVRSSQLTFNGIKNSLQTAVSNGQFNIFLEEFVEEQGAGGFDGATSTSVTITGDNGSDDIASTGGSDPDGDDLFGADVGQTYSILILCGIAISGACCLGLIFHYYKYGTIFCKFIPPLWFQRMCPFLMCLITCEWSEHDNDHSLDENNLCSNCYRILCCCCAEYDSDEGVQEIEVRPRYRRNAAGESFLESDDESEEEDEIYEPFPPDIGQRFYDDYGYNSGVTNTIDRFQNLYRSESGSSVSSFEHRRRGPPKSVDSSTIASTPSRSLKNGQGYQSLQRNGPTANQQLDAISPFHLPYAIDEEEEELGFQTNHSNNAYYDDAVRPASPAENSVAGSTIVSAAESAAYSHTSSSVDESSLAGMHVLPSSGNNSVAYSADSEVQPVQNLSIQAFLALDCRSNDTYVSSDTSSRPMETRWLERNRTLSSSAVDVVDPNYMAVGQHVAELDPNTVAAAAFAEAAPVSSVVASADFAPHRRTHHRK